VPGRASSVAEEARVTSALMGTTVDRWSVGVADYPRLLRSTSRLRSEGVECVRGDGGIAASWVGDCWVFPSFRCYQVGYGASFGGVAALSSEC